jgi:hypothetical protein
MAMSETRSNHPFCEVIAQLSKVSGRRKSLEKLFLNLQCCDLQRTYFSEKLKRAIPFPE